MDGPPGLPRRMELRETVCVALFGGVAFGGCLETLERLSREKPDHELD
jgi:hypothetical protein